MTTSEDLTKGTVEFHLVKAAEYLDTAESLYDESPDDTDPDCFKAFAQSRTASLIAQGYAALAQAQIAYGSFTSTDQS